MKTYKIVRFWKSGRKRVMRRGLTLEEARSWCQREDTHGANWFDGFTAE